MFGFAMLSELFHVVQNKSNSINTHKIIEIMCYHCGNFPSAVYRDGLFHYDKVKVYKLQAGSTNRKVYYYLCRLFVRRTYGVLGRRHRVRLLYCYEQYMKMMYPNTDSSNFVGY